MQTYNNCIVRRCTRLVLLGCMVVVMMSGTMNAAFASSCTANPSCSVPLRVSVTLTPGMLSASLGAVMFPGGSTIVLNGHDQAITYLLPILVNDSRGTGVGWKVSIISTVFSTSPVLGHTLPANATFVIANSITCLTVCSPVNPPNVGPLPAGFAAPLVLEDATHGQGMGSYQLTPTFKTTVPASAFAGTYRSTFTVIVAAAP